MKDSPTPPAAPSPQEMGNAQQTSNINTAVANARLNRVNTTTPYGNLVYTQGPVDANGVPTYSAQISLDPQQQQILDNQRQQQLTRQGMANTVLSNNAGVLTRPLDLQHLHAMLDTNGKEYLGAITQEPPVGQMGSSTAQPSATSQSNSMGTISPDALGKMNDLFGSLYPDHPGNITGQLNPETEPMSRGTGNMPPPDMTFPTMPTGAFDTSGSAGMGMTKDAGSYDMGGSDNTGLLAGQAPVTDLSTQAVPVTDRSIQANQGLMGGLGGFSKMSPQQKAMLIGSLAAILRRGAK